MKSVSRVACAAAAALLMLGAAVASELGAHPRSVISRSRLKRLQALAGEGTRELVEPYTMSNSMVVLGAQGRYVGIARGDPKGSVSFTTPVFKNLEIYVTGLAPESTYAVDSSGQFTTNVRVYPAREGKLSTAGGVLGIKMLLQTQRKR